jgi:hypothetical protein
VLLTVRVEEILRRTALEKPREGTLPGERARGGRRLEETPIHEALASQLGGREGFLGGAGRPQLGHDLAAVGHEDRVAALDVAQVRREVDLEITNPNCLHGLNVVP